jgi:glycosyltransferase involved in cell wall biosynthesis
MFKNILIIGPAHPLRGGLASYNERLAREFQREGHSCALYTFSLQYPGFLFPGTTQYSSEPAPENLTIHVKLNSINPLNWWQCGRNIRKMNPDIIVVRYWLPFMGPCLGTVLRLIKKNKHTKVICIADNIIPHEKRPGDDLFTRYFLKPIDGFITMSQKVLNDLKPLSNKPAQFINHPLYDNFGNALPQHEALQHLKLDPNRRWMLFFGFIRPYKGLKLLLEAMHLLKTNGWLEKEKISLLIAGEFYDDPAPYHQLIEQYQLQNNINLHTDFIPDSEVRYYFSAANRVVQPYLQATQSGVTPLAYHFNVPMLVTRVGALADLVPPAIGEVAEPNAESVAEHIQRLFERDTKSMQEAIEREKGQYAWSNITRAILSLAENA